MYSLHSQQAFALRRRQRRLELEGATAEAELVGAEAEAEEAMVAAAEAQAEADWDGRGNMPRMVALGRLRANQAQCRAEAEAAKVIVVADAVPLLPVTKAWASAGRPGVATGKLMPVAKRVPAKARPTGKAKAAAPGKVRQGRLIGSLLLQARCRAQRLIAAEAAEVIVVEDAAPLVPVTKAWAFANRRRILPVKSAPAWVKAQAKAAAPVKRTAVKSKGLGLHRLRLLHQGPWSKVAAPAKVVAKAAAPAKVVAKAAVVKTKAAAPAKVVAKAAVEAKAVEAKAVAKAAAPVKVAAKAVFDFDAFRARVHAHMNNPMLRARPIPPSGPPPQNAIRAAEAPKRKFGDMD